MIRVDLSLPLDRFELRVDVVLDSASAAILGPSGAGKTALIESIAGLRSAWGRVEVGGVLLQDASPGWRGGLRLPPEKRRLGYVPQEGALFPHLSVRSNLLFGCPRSGRDRGPDDLAAVVAALELEPLLDRSPRFLSGGEQRRVALARALLARPRLLLLDEPTAGLDPVRARKALARVRQVRRDLDVPLLVVTHRPEEAVALADEVVVLGEGAVRDVGPVREVLARLARGAGAEAETLVEAQVEAHRPGDGVTRVRLVGCEERSEAVSVPYTPDLAVGEMVVLAVGANEVLVALERPVGLSARNAVEVVVEGIEPVGGRGGVGDGGSAGEALLLRAGPWLAYLTLEAVRDLELRVGGRVWVVVKTHAWRVVAG